LRIPLDLDACTSRAGGSEGLVGAGTRTDGDFKPTSVPPMGALAIRPGALDRPTPGARRAGDNVQDEACWLIGSPTIQPGGMGGDGPTVDRREMHSTSWTRLPAGYPAPHHGRPPFHDVTRALQMTQAGAIGRYGGLLDSYAAGRLELIRTTRSQRVWRPASHRRICLRYFTGGTRLQQYGFVAGSGDRLCARQTLRGRASPG